MNDALDRRLAALTGLAIAAAVALWWLGSTRLALDHGADASRSAADALQALGLARALALPLLGVPLGARCGWRAGSVAALGLLAPAWPVLVVVWSASRAGWFPLLLAEGALLAAGLALPAIGLGVRRGLRRPELVDAVAMGTGAALMAPVWLARGGWVFPS